MKPALVFVLLCLPALLCAADNQIVSTLQYEGTASTIVINTTDLYLAQVEVLRDTTFQIHPGSSHSVKQRFSLELTSKAKYKLTWDTTKFKAPFSAMQLPTETTGGGKKDMFGFQYAPLTDTWEFMSSTQCVTCPKP
jgi:hypothetical protein